MTSDPHDTVRRWLEAANRFDLGYIAANATADIRSTMHSFGIDTQGKEAFLESTKAVWQALPDRRFHIQSMISTGTTVIAEVSCTATSPGGRDYLPPTGQPMTLDLCMIFSIRDRLISKERVYFDPGAPTTGPSAPPQP
ncbi:ester cyclase [Streptomyces sp. DK15]|uniref:nuclear transport factor 2 family protein n=1 Tax=Streptomyces sp. DK15 TaxID=2957499 RepID=UPI0029BD2CB9|nr:nuclear transport factor 2 family protein [Streptomyces sp. DK15]MDX2394039.1 ester cyclase [Streptomyces sp. DK15]